jgi:asparagine N-glycosylation enzyme membrane subunit Stt3
MNRIRPLRPIALVRQAGSPNSLEYVVLFLGVVAGVLAIVR